MSELADIANLTAVISSTWRQTSQVKSRIAVATTGGKIVFNFETGFGLVPNGRLRWLWYVPGDTFGTRFGTAETLISGLCDLGPETYTLLDNLRTRDKEHCPA
jgi:hypothetical protein